MAALAAHQAGHMGSAKVTATGTVTVRAIYDAINATAPRRPFLGALPVALEILAHMIIATITPYYRVITDRLSLKRFTLVL